MKRTLYFISDGTGISVETLGRSLLTQFEGITFQTITLRYVNTIDKAHQAVKQINAEVTATHSRPIILSTIADKLIRDQVFQANACCIDFFQYLLSPLEKELAISATGAIGLSHAILNDDFYNTRIDAVNYALTYDDGASLRGYPSADIILLGVSRSGKTPTCLYLAMQFGIQAANYPITEEDFDTMTLPQSLENFRSQLFGLTISPERLNAIRTKRKPNSRYASLEQCQYEIGEVENLFKQESITYLNSTLLSVEELATQIMSKAALKPKI